MNGTITTTLFSQQVNQMNETPLQALLSKIIQAAETNQAPISQDDLKALFSSFSLEDKRACKNKGLLIIQKLFFQFDGLDTCTLGIFPTQRIKKAAFYTGFLSIYAFRLGQDQTLATALVSFVTEKYPEHPFLWLAKAVRKDQVKGEKEYIDLLWLAGKAWEKLK